MITLYIKTHNKTGLKYFGKTIKKDIEKYTGSGKYWKNHIHAHGYDVTTEIYAQFEEECDDLINTALYFSESNNIVNSKEWANLIPENGLGGFEACNNRQKHLRKVDPEWAKKVEEKRLKSLKLYYENGGTGPNFGKKLSQEWIDNMRIKRQDLHWVHNIELNQNKMATSLEEKNKLLNDGWKVGRLGLDIVKLECELCGKIISKRNYNQHINSNICKKLQS